MNKLNKSSLEQLMLADLKRSGLHKHADVMKVRPFTAAQLQAKYPGLTKYPRAGYQLPYFDKHGKQSAFFRFRFVEDPEPNAFGGVVAKPLRYIQPTASPEIYLAPFGSGNWKVTIEDAAAPLIITEGEKKAALATLLNLATIGLGGVFNFESKTEAFLPSLAEFAWVGRPVYIVFDSDINTNRNVQIAAARLARQLLRRGARVFILRLEAPEPGQKYALDDLLIEKDGKRRLEQLKEDAEEFEDSHELHRLNERVVYVHNHSIFEVATGKRIRPREFKESVYSDWTFEVKTEAANGDVKRRTFSTATEWMKWSGRAKAPAYVYEPGRERILPEGINDWNGWGVAEEFVKKGDVELWHELVAHLFSEDKRRWFEQWLAYPLQNPGAHLYTAVLNKGPQGTGKDLLINAVGRIYGDNFDTLKESALEAKHHKLMEHKQQISIEEFTGGETNRRVLYDKFKTLITRPTLAIEPKFLDAYNVRNCINYYVSSNRANPIHLDPDDRRWFINQVTKSPKERAFYNAFGARFMEGNEGVGALFHYLLNVDLSDFDPRSPAPMTMEKAELISISQSDPARWAKTLFATPDAILIHGGKSLNLSLMTETELHVLYYDNVKEDRLRTLSMMKSVLLEAGVRKANGGNQVRGCSKGWGKPRLYIVRDRDKWQDAKEKALATQFNKERHAAKPPFDKLMGRELQ